MLTKALDASNSGFYFLSLVGEPGVGKTRLIDELASAAVERKFLTLYGRASEFEQEMPLGVLLDALGERLEHDVGDLLESLSSASNGRPVNSFPTSHLALPGLASRVAQADHTALARYRTYRAIRRLLDRLTAPPGLVLILDDVHWADETTTAFLDHLVRHPPTGPMLVTIAYRPAQARPQLAALADAAAEYGGQISVKPLDKDEVEQFLGPGVSPARRQSLYEASGGNPFYLEALARMDAGGPMAAVPDRRWQGVVGYSDDAELPSEVQVALQVELSGLSETGQLMAHAAALVADEFDPTAAAVAADMPPDVALEAIDELVAYDIVRPVALGGTFQFRHPLVRQAAYQSASAGWRVAAHGRIFAHLARLGAPATAQAHHAERSAQYGDRHAITTLIDAARTVASQAPTTAAHWFRAALRLLPEDREDDAMPGRPELLLDLARVESMSGRLTESRDTTREALRLLPHTDHIQRARVVKLCSMMERLVGCPDKANDLLQAELGKIPDSQPEATVPLRLRLAAENLYRTDVRGAQSVLDRIPDHPDAYEPGADVAVAAMRAMPAYAARRTDDAIQYLEKVDQFLASAPDEHVADWLDALAWTCWTDLLMGRYSVALRRINRCVAVARSSGQSYLVTNMLAGLAWAHSALGQLDKAEIAAEEAAEVARFLNSRQALVFALNQQCLAASWSGDDETALRLGEEAVRACGNTDEWWAALARYARGVTLINAGRQAAGAEAILDACNGFQSPRLDQSTLLLCCEEMAQVEAARGEFAEAAVWANRADRLVCPELGVNIGMARLARAHALSGSSPATAAEYAREAATLLAAQDAQVDAGRARLRAGLSYADLDKRGQARDELRAAAEIFATCGARGMHARATRGLRRLGVHTPATGRRRGGGPYGLSRRESEVARLVTEGHTNVEIADRLVLSLRTVETHITHIFAKLGVSSRVGLVKALTRNHDF